MNAVAELGSKLNEMGLTLQALMIATGVLTVLFFFSFREILSWYLKTSKVLSQQQQILEKLAALETQLGHLKVSGQNIENILNEAPLFPISTPAQNQLKVTDGNLAKEAWMSKPLV